MNSPTINISKTALVVIDLQHGMVGLDLAPHIPEVVVQNSVAIAVACRKNNMPVFLVRVTPSPDGKDALYPTADIQAHPHERPSNWAEIVPEMGPEKSDFVITKHQWGAFYGTELDLQMRRRGVDTIILCGISTNIGVESTARCAYEYGYHQIFIEDAMSALKEEEHRMTIEKVFPRIGLVRTTEDILASLQENI